VRVQFRRTICFLNAGVIAADHASALAFELLRGPAPERREFLRIKFKNGTNSEFETYHIFGHKGDIAVTEFMYRLEVRCVSFMLPSTGTHFFPCRTLLLQAKNNGHLRVESPAPPSRSHLLLRA
jgi:hypothetical protein